MRPPKVSPRCEDAVRIGRQRRAMWVNNTHQFVSTTLVGTVESFLLHTTV